MSQVLDRGNDQNSLAWYSRNQHVYLSLPFQLYCLELSFINSTLIMNFPQTVFYASPLNVPFLLPIALFLLAQYVLNIYPFFKNHSNAYYIMETFLIIQPIWCIQLIAPTFNLEIMLLLLLLWHFILFCIISVYTYPSFSLRFFFYISLHLIQTQTGSSPHHVDID